MPSKSKSVLLPFLVTIALLSGCASNGDVVHQRSMAELNQKAMALMSSGNVDGAIARLESAHDLDPDEPNTIHNLAVAYQARGDYDKAIQMFTLLLKKPGVDQAETNKSLGITYEARGDKESQDVKDAEDNPKADKTMLAQASQQAIADYRTALDYYQKSLSGVRNKAEVQKQIDALNARLAKES